MQACRNTQRLINTCSHHARVRAMDKLTHAHARTHTRTHTKPTQARNHRPTLLKNIVPIKSALLPLSTFCYTHTHTHTPPPVGLGSLQWARLRRSLYTIRPACACVSIPASPFCLQSLSPVLSFPIALTFSLYLPRSLAHSISLYHSLYLACSPSLSLSLSNSVSLSLFLLAISYLTHHFALQGSVQIIPFFGE